MILEGYRLHYDEPLVVHTPDADLALLLGDQLYALGLSRLAALGDLDAVAELADVISLVAQAHAASDRELAHAVWEAGAVSVGWGPSDAHAEAKASARVHDAGARRRPARRRLVRFVASRRPPACEVRIEVVRPARTARLGDDLFAVMAVRCRQSKFAVRIASVRARPTQGKEVEVHARPEHPRRVRGRDRHPPADDESGRQRRRRGRRGRVHAPRARIRARADLQAPAVDAGRRSARPATSPRPTT